MNRFSSPGRFRAGVSTWRRTLRLSLQRSSVATLAALTTACARSVIPYPPPTPLPTLQENIPAHHWNGTVGTSYAVSRPDVSNPTLEAAPNLLGGPLLLAGGYGLTDRQDLTLAFSFESAGPTMGLQYGSVVHRRPHLDLGVTGGLAWSRNRITLTSADASTTSDSTTHTYTYTYQTFAPSLGGRFAWTCRPGLQLVGSLRGSYAFTVGVPGTGDNEEAFWFEPMVGVQATPRSGPRVGLGIGGYITDYSIDNVFLNAASIVLSIGYSFPIRSEAGPALQPIASRVADAASPGR